MNIPPKLQRIRTRMVMNGSYAFFTSIALEMPLIDGADKLPVPTMGTDGKAIYYHPEFVEQHDEDFLTKVYIHEIMHVVMLTPWRQQWRTAMAQDAAGNKVSVWNLATDHANNLAMQADGMVLPDGATCDPKYSGWQAEAIYDDILQNLKPPPAGSSGLAGCYDGVAQDDQVVGPGSQPDPADEANAKRMIAQAAAVAQARGSLPASLKHLVDEILAPRRNWRDELIRYFQSVAPLHERWDRPIRRLMHRGIRLPTVHSPVLGRVYFGVDTSGSTWPYIEDFAQTVHDIYATCAPEHTTVAYCDTRVSEVQEFSRDQPVEFHIVGGGGTDLRALFEHAERLDEPPDLMIVLTDMESPWPDEPPPFPVLFVASLDYPAPFGDIIYIK